MNGRNPYALSFGRVPTRYISRDVIIGEIVDSISSDVVEEQAFKLTGIRGTGKTVTLTAIEREVKEDDKWIVAGLRPNGDILRDLVSNLYSDVPFITKFIDSDLNLSAFGIGISLKRKDSPITSMDVALKKIMSAIKKKGKRVLITIDEVRKTDQLVDFIQEFQLLIREDLPVYLVVAGLYEDIESIENTDGLTFFLRAARYEMSPLSIDIIREDYKEALGLDTDTAKSLALLTKGYAFAYQAFGKYMWESGGKEITDLVLAKVDDVLAQKVYEKIWSELMPKDRWFMSFIAQKESMSVAELLEITKQKHNEWSGPRKRLIEKGVLKCSERGKISIALPRFENFVLRMGEEF